VFDGREGVLLEAWPEPETWVQIREAWDRFMTCIATDTLPPLTDRDAVIRSDPEWQAAAHAFIELKRSAEEAAERLDAAKQRLILIATHKSELGAGVSVTRFWKSGSVDYKKIPELATVDLEAYRGPVREETRIALVK
jgi:hypothetical protein